MLTCSLAYVIPETARYWFGKHCDAAILYGKVPWKKSMHAKESISEAAWLARTDCLNHSTRQHDELHESHTR
jgi:hypothetical protein